MIAAGEVEWYAKFRTRRPADTAYVAANLEGHKKLLTIQADYLMVGTNREHLSIANLARGTVKEHIAHLEELQATLG